MAKNSVNDYETTAGNNTDIQSVNIAEGCAPSNINNAIRELMADLAGAFQGGVTATAINVAALNAQTATVTALSIGTYTAVSAARQVTAGLGLSGGGALSSDVTLALDVSDLTATATYVATADYVAIYRTAATGTYKALVSTVVPPGGDTATGTWRAASQAEMEAGTETGVLVTPGRQQHHLGHPKVWGAVNQTGTQSILADYNVASIADNGTGLTTFTYDVTFGSSTAYGIVGLGRPVSSSNSALMLDRDSGPSSTTCRVSNQTFGGSDNDSSRVGVACFGDL